MQASVWPWLFTCVSAFHAAALAPKVSYAERWGKEKDPPGISQRVLIAVGGPRILRARQNAGYKIPWRGPWCKTRPEHKGQNLSIHSFDTEIAKRVGLNAAVLYQNIVFWAEHNMRNRRHFHEGRWWTFNSRRAFMEQFDYLTEDQIRHALSKLEKAGLIKKGRFNQKGYDKTTWYSPDISVDWTLGENSPMDRGKKPNGSGEVPQPIPDSKPDHKPDCPYRSADALGENFVEGFAGRMPPSKPTGRKAGYASGAMDRSIRSAAAMRRAFDDSVF